jgi:membrane associated rhomboid family serine protease
VHIGFFHLAVNMYSLFVVGPLLERLWGSAGFLVLYLLAGLGGSCGMLIEIPLGGGAGASGAIWGVLASLATWLFLNRSVLPRQLIVSMQRQLIVVFLLNIFITFGVAQISKGAHFGGGIVGLLVALPLDVLRFGRGKQRWVALAALVAIPIICVAAAVMSLNRARDELAVVGFEEEYILPIQEVLREARSTLRPFLADNQEDPPPDAVRTIIVDLAREQDELVRQKTRLEEANVSREFTKRRSDALADVSQIIALFTRVETRLQRGETLTPNERESLESFFNVTRRIH